MTFPTRITPQWLLRTVPTMSASEYEALLVVLVEREWLGEYEWTKATWSFGIAMLEALLQPAVRREVEERRQRRLAA